MPRKRINAKTKIDDPWKALSGAISDTLSAKESDLRLTMIMQACNDLVGKGKFDLIYNGVCEQLTNHFKEWHNQLVNVAGDPLLTKLSDMYDYFKKYCVIIPTLCSSYDQHFSSEPNKLLKTIRKLFIMEILSDERLFRRAATPGILEVIYNAQKGSDVDLSKIKNIIQMYYSFNGRDDKPEIFLDFFDRLKQQENDFCDSFYANTFGTTFFTTYLTKTSEQFSIVNHILNDNRLLKEKEANEILTNFNLSLLHLKEDDFLTGDEPPISEALLSNDLRPLSYLVKTYLEFGFDTEPLYLTCATFIKNEMLKSAQDFTQEENGRQNNVVPLVDGLIKKTIKLSEPYKKIFVDEKKKDKKELNILIEKIKEAWNDRQFSIAVNFNDYIDALIKSKFRGYDIDEQIRIIPEFYNYLTDKALFHLYYEYSFTRRIVRMRASVEEYDYPIINAIQKHATDFMKNLDSFKKALSNSEQLKQDFEDAYPEIKNDVTIEPFIFENNVYPLKKDKFDHIPSTAQNSNTKFQQFFNSKHSKKSLFLVYDGSYVEFSLKIQRRIYTVSMDLPCGCVFSALIQKQCTFGEIVTLLNEDKPLANKVIQKLYQREKIITSTEPFRKLTSEIIFKLNPKFHSDTSRIIMSQIITGEWRAHVPNVHEREKRDAIKCAIARTLKQRRSMVIGDLEREVLTQLRARYEISAELIRREVSQMEGTIVSSRQENDGNRVITYIG